MFTIYFASFVFSFTWRTKQALNTRIELPASPSAQPTYITAESFSIKFCTEVHADIDRGSLILVRTGQTQAPLTPTN
jgi:hypothetical protein